MLKDKQNNMDERMPDSLLAGMFPHQVVVVSEQQFQQADAQTTTKKPSHEIPSSPKSDIIDSPLQKIDASQTILPTHPPLKWLGDFSRKVLIVVDYPNEAFISDADFLFLSKILEAVKFSITDVAIVNKSRQPIDYQSLNALLTPNVAIYVGFEPADIGLPMRFPYFQVQPWNHTTFLYIPALFLMNTDDADAVKLKKQLWSALKQIFLTK